MEMRMNAGQSLQQKIGQKLNQKQSLAIRQGLLLRQRELVEAVQGTRYQPRAECLACGHRLTDLEILKGFRDDPTDYTTQCPKCKARFEPKLYAASQYSRVLVAYYCPTQTLQQLPALRDVSLYEFRTKYSAVYNSAVVHFGGLKQAFARLGMTYAHEADLDWRKNVGPFLGKMPDTVIAKLLGTKVGQVRRLRNSKGIGPFRHRDLLKGKAGILKKHVDDDSPPMDSEPSI